MKSDNTSKHCEHGRRRYYCVDCGGKGICIHKRRKGRCKDCKGSDRCVHDRDRYDCKLCGSKAFCHHGRRKYVCVGCGGKGICIHKRRKSICKDCKGSERCVHDRVRSTCKQCQGAGICPHGKLKRRCVDCDGSAICSHRFVATSCSICSPYKCEGCNLAVVNVRNRDGKRLCSTCNPYSRRRSLYDKNRPENKVNDYLAKHFDQVYPVGTYAPFRTCEDQKKPDTIVIETDLMAIVETDENAHENYLEICEWAKALNHGQSGLQTDGIARVAFIRFNPDTWKVAGSTVRFKFTERLEVLRDLIRELSSTQEDDFTIHHCFYPRDDDEKVVKTEKETLEYWIHRCSLLT